MSSREDLLNALQSALEPGLSYIHRRELLAQVIDAIVDPQPEVKLWFDPDVWSSGAPEIQYAKDGDAAFDLMTSEAIILHPRSDEGDYKQNVSTGMYLAIPPGFEGQVRPRSGSAFKQGLSIVNTPGTIDSGYRGELKVALINHGSNTIRFEKGHRIAQMVITRVATAKLVRVATKEELGATERGEGGFGSTGK